MQINVTKVKKFKDKWWDLMGQVAMESGLGIIVIFAFQLLLYFRKHLILDLVFAAVILLCYIIGHIDAYMQVGQKVPRIALEKTIASLVNLFASLAVLIFVMVSVRLPMIMMIMLVMIPFVILVMWRSAKRRIDI